MTCSLVQRGNFVTLYLPKKEGLIAQTCIRNGFIPVMTHATFHFNQLMVTPVTFIKECLPLGIMEAQTDGQLVGPFVLCKE